MGVAGRVGVAVAAAATAGGTAAAATRLLRAGEGERGGKANVYIVRKRAYERAAHISSERKGDGRGAQQLDPTAVVRGSGRARSIASENVREDLRLLPQMGACESEEIKRED